MVCFHFPENESKTMNYDHWRNYVRGWLLHFLNQPEAAYNAYVVAFHHAPDDIQTASHLAAIAGEKKRWEVAESWFEKVVALAPDDAHTWFNLGFVREHAGKVDAALAAFDTAIALHPVLDRAWYGKGLAHARRNEHDAAAAALEKVVALQPMYDGGWYQLGMAYHHANRPDEVTRIVKRLLNFKPQRAKQLAQDTGRTDLMPLIPDLPWNT